MTKQSQAHVSAEEKPTPELLLRRFNLMDAAVDEVRKANLAARLEPKYMDLYIQWRASPNKWIHSHTVSFSNMYHINAWGSEGTRDDQFSDPHSMAVYR